MADAQILITRGSTWPGFVIQCYSDQAQTQPFDLTNYTPNAQIRPKPGSDILTLNLNPAKTGSPTGGQVTIPAVENAATLAIKKGNYSWDFTITYNPTGDTTNPLIQDSVIVQEKVTQP